ncbi:hypothetical protein [Flocculibacter collagenilyticus]|uniref:hypothetical protein n=1 Tax=Flocculibacter collagenilyticus TaxID=2744479 RepID=UPI0018F4CE4A|nr:hypothetical protein [Flocculibacter collagenilyticus]
MKTFGTIILTIIGVALYILAVLYGNATYYSYYSWTIMPALAAMSSVGIFFYLGYKVFKKLPPMFLNSYDAASLSHLNLIIMNDQCAIDAAIANYHIKVDLNSTFTPFYAPSCSYT